MTGIELPQHDDFPVIDELPLPVTHAQTTERLTSLPSQTELAVSSEGVGEYNASVRLGEAISSSSASWQIQTQSDARTQSVSESRPETETNRGSHAL